jgi:hypothetical protein
MKGVILGNRKEKTLKSKTKAGALAQGSINVNTHSHGPSIDLIIA